MLARPVHGGWRPSSPPAAERRADSSRPAHRGRWPGMCALTELSASRAAGRLFAGGIVPGCVIAFGHNGMSGGDGTPQDRPGGDTADDIDRPPTGAPGLGLVSGTGRGVTGIAGFARGWRAGRSSPPGHSWRAGGVVLASMRASLAVSDHPCPDLPTAGCPSPSFDATGVKATSHC